MKDAIGNSAGDWSSPRARRNITLTFRKWLIDCYIAEYDFRGQDRANYGHKVLNSLAAELSRLAVSNSNLSQLNRYLRFYWTYPGIVGTLSPHSGHPSDTLDNRLSPRDLELTLEISDEAERRFKPART